MTARAFIFVIAVMLGASSALAHDARPIFIQLTESAASPDADNADGEANASTSETTVQLQWRVPKLRAAIPVPEVTLSETCRPLAGRTEFNLRDSRLFEQSYACTDGLGGTRLTIQYPGPNPAISSLVRIERASGETYSRLLQPDELEYEIPAKRTTLEVAADYTAFGVAHILKGADHLLFVACLLLLARTWKRTLVTITGFTVAHSVTLVLSTLGVVRLPVPPVEATIALSIVFVARELAVGKTDSLTVRYPIAVSSSFGLLHGFGFASVLANLGLPKGEVPAALLSFNVGVEIGQILFVAVLWFVFLLLHPPWSKSGAMSAGESANSGEGSNDPATKTSAIGSGTAFISPFERPAVYVIGALAVFWTIDRIMAF